MEIYYSFLFGILSIVVVIVISGIIPLIVMALGLMLAEAIASCTPTFRTQIMIWAILSLISLPLSITLASNTFAKLTQPDHDKIVISSGIVPVKVVEIAPGKNLYLTVKIGEEGRIQFLLKRKCDIKVNDVYNVDVTRYKFSDDPDNTVYVEMKEVETSFCGE